MVRRKKRGMLCGCHSSSVLGTCHVLALLIPLYRGRSSGSETFSHLPGPPSIHVTELRLLSSSSFSSQLPSWGWNLDLSSPEFPAFRGPFGFRKITFPLLRSETFNKRWRDSLVIILASLLHCKHFFGSLFSLKGSYLWQGARPCLWVGWGFDFFFFDR